jgi:hypothetical protein
MAISMGPGANPKARTGVVMRHLSNGIEFWINLIEKKLGQRNDHSDTVILIRVVFSAADSLFEFDNTGTH